jgi:hypothetical protein
LGCGAESAAREFNSVAVSVCWDRFDLRGRIGLRLEDGVVGGLCERLDVEFWTLAGHEDSEVCPVAMGAGRWPRRLRTDRQAAGSVRSLVAVGTARALLPEVDRADRLICRAGDGFEVAVVMEEGESRFFRGCGHQEV